MLPCTLFIGQTFIGQTAVRIFGYLKAWTRDNVHGSLSLLRLDHRGVHHIYCIQGSHSFLGFRFPDISWHLLTNFQQIQETPRNEFFNNGVFYIIWPAPSPLHQSLFTNLLLIVNKTLNINFLNLIIFDRLFHNPTLVPFHQFNSKSQFTQKDN